MNHIAKLITYKTGEILANMKCIRSGIRNKLATKFKKLNSYF